MIHFFKIIHVLIKYTIKRGYFSVQQLQQTKDFLLWTKNKYKCSRIPEKETDIAAERTGCYFSTRISHKALLYKLEVEGKRTEMRLELFEDSQNCEVWNKS